MKLHIFMDSDVILDLILKRDDYVSALNIFSLAEKNLIKIYTSSLSIANIHYILSKSSKVKEPKEIIKDLFVLLSILPFEADAIDFALSSHGKDFEDCIQCYIAEKHNLDLILTRNIRDYKSIASNVATPSEFLHNHKFS